MTLTLYIHPLASFCHKVLIALGESGTPFIARTVDLADADSSAELLAAWPVGKIPVLHDAATGQTIPETSIIIEYLQQHYPSAAKLLPDDAGQRLDARLWDRFFDLYVSVPMQKIVADRNRPEHQLDPYGTAEARTMLRTAYPMIERQVGRHEFAIGDAFSIADCAAAPALFFARIVEPFGPDLPNLASYFERLMARPSVVQTIAAAKPYFSMFPYQEAMEPRFRT